jgi:predicted O-methyltransferase YrrM
MASITHRIKDLLAGLPALSPLSLAMLFRRPSRLPLYLSDCLRAYRHHAGLRIPAITPWELLGFKDIVTLRLGENGLYAAMEPNFLMMQLVAMLRPEKIFEIGTSQGRTTALMAMNAPLTTRIFTLDLPPDLAVPDHATDMHLIELARRELGIAFRDSPWQLRITQLMGDSGTFDFSPYYDAMDLVTIDGSHTYEFVRSDSLNAFRMIRPGGVILWHDYESMRSEYGVSKFVDSLRHQHGLPTYRLSRDQGDTRCAVLRVGADEKKQLMKLTNGA